MKVILEFIAVASTAIIPSIYSTIRSIRLPVDAEEPSPMERLFGGLLWSVSAITIVLIISLGQPEGLRSVGVFNKEDDSILSPYMIAMLGLAGVAFILWVVRRLLHIDLKEHFAPSKPYVARIIQYDRNRWERLTFLAQLPLAVMAEELVYRGYLVLLLGKYTGAYIPWIILSIALSVVIHLYQGRDRTTILSHLLMATLFVGVTVYSGSIFPATTVHFLGNTGFTFRIWSQASKRKKAEEDAGHPEDEPTLYVPTRRTRLYGLILIAASVLMLACLCCIFTGGFITINGNPIDIW
jgi:membrane protease YdiL (CAAX protease family)